MTNTIESESDAEVLARCELMEFALNNIDALPTGAAKFVRDYFADVDAELAAWEQRPLPVSIAAAPKPIATG